MKSADVVDAIRKAEPNHLALGSRWAGSAPETVTGRYDGEHYNLGFVNQVDLPYPEMVRFARETLRARVIMDE